MQCVSIIEYNTFPREHFICAGVKQIMEKQKYSLRTNIGFFLNKSIGYSQDFLFDYPEIFIEPDLKVFNLHSELRFSRTREGLLLQADLGGQIETNCVRCLGDFLVDVSTKIEELYMFAQRSSNNATDLLIPDDGYIDLGVIFREYLLLEIPINPICDVDCKGICIVCGQNLNENDCGHLQILSEPEIE